MQRQIISRAFNHFEISKDYQTITKTSKNNHKLVNEINWFLKLPEKFQKFIPKIYDYSLNSNNAFIKMQFYKDKQSFDQVFLHQKLSQAEISNFFKTLQKFIDLSKKQKSSNTNNQVFLKEIYLTKTLSRLSQLANQDNFKYFFNHPFQVNKHKYQPLNFYLTKLENVLNQNDLLKNRGFCLIHGDLCFNNIFFNGSLTLIDPRGEFGMQGIYGDPLYEYAKIKHSISGYDQIINDLYDLSYTKDSINYAFHANPNQKNFLKEFNQLISKFPKKTQHQIDLIEGLLFLSMIPLHQENFKHQLLMLALAVSKLDKYFK